MKLIDVINGPWALLPEMLCEIRSIYAKHLRGEKIDKSILEQLASQNNVRKSDEAYDVVNGSAVIPVEGVLAKKMNLFMAISGGTSTQLVERDIRKALEDPSVEQIILHIDSPGGTVDGTFELSDFIYANRDKKPIIAFTDGMMYSAAYAIGSAASAVYIASGAVGVGSIGVVAAHEDWSKYEERIGIKTTEIYAGKYKRIASQYKPLDNEGKQSIQEEVDYLHSVFVETVARNRGVSPETVTAQMSTDVKSAFIGQQAVDAGHVDGIATLDQIIGKNFPKRQAGSAKRADETAVQTKTAEAGEPAADKGGISMDLKELQEKHSDLYKSVLEEGKKAGAEEGRAAGAESERNRIKAVSDIGKKMPGHSALIEGLMFDGKTTGPEAAVALVEAEGSKRAKHLADYREDGKDVKVPVTDSTASDAAAAADKQSQEDKSLPVEERAKAAWDADARLRTEFGGNYANYLAWYKASDAGQVKVFTKK